LAGAAARIVSHWTQTCGNNSVSREAKSSAKHPAVRMQIAKDFKVKND
jgi:hypothetical protein